MFGYITENDTIMNVCSKIGETHILNRLYQRLYGKFRLATAVYRNGNNGIARGPYNSPLFNPLVYVRVPRMVSGLPVDIYVMDSDKYVKTGMPLIALFSNNYGDALSSKLVPITISRTPKILGQDIKLDITTEDFRRVRDFIRQERKELIIVSAGPPSSLRTFEFMKQVEERQHKKC